MVYDGIIQGKTVNLRSVTEADAEVTYKMRSDPEKSRFFHAATGTVQDQLEYIKNQREKDGDYLFLFEDKNGNALGMKGLYNFNPEEGSVESGRFVGFGSQVQNIEALLLSLDFAFEELHVKHVNMAALESNTMMLEIQKKIGTEVSYRERLDEFNCDNIHSTLDRETYMKNRRKIAKLIDRFAQR